MNDNLTFSGLAISDDDLIFIVASDGRMRKMTWADVATYTSKAQVATNTSGIATNVSAIGLNTAVRALTDATIIKFSVADPAAASATAVHAAVALVGGDTTRVTTEITDPDYPRTLSITGSASGITGNVVINGINYSGEFITDTIASSGASTVNGAKAFKTIADITLPAKTNESGDTISIGTTIYLGLNRVANTVLPVKAVFNDVVETTLPTITIDDTDIEKNLISFDSALDGSSVVCYYLNDV